MGKHAIGGMRSMMVPNRKADMRFRKKAYLRNKERSEADRPKKGGDKNGAETVPVLRRKTANEIQLCGTEEKAMVRSMQMRRKDGWRI